MRRWIGVKQVWMGIGVVSRERYLPSPVRDSGSDLGWEGGCVGGVMRELYED